MKIWSYFLKTIGILSALVTLFVFFSGKTSFTQSIQSISSYFSMSPKDSAKNAQKIIILPSENKINRNSDNLLTTIFKALVVYFVAVLIFLGCIISAFWNSLFGYFHLVKVRSIAQRRFGTYGGIK